MSNTTNISNITKKPYYNEDIAQSYLAIYKKQQHFNDRNVLIEYCLPIIDGYVNKNWRHTSNKNNDIEDIKKEIVLILISCIENYDPTKNTTLFSWINTGLKYCLWNYNAKLNKESKVFCQISLNCEEEQDTNIKERNRNKNKDIISNKLYDNLFFLLEQAHKMTIDEFNILSCLISVLYTAPVCSKLKYVSLVAEIKKRLSLTTEDWEAFIRKCQEIYNTYERVQ